MAHDKPLYERDSEAWNAHLAEGNARQPRKRVAADVILRDEHGRLLLVNPNYKPDWDLPGGMAEANEPPIEAAARELREELGLVVEIGALLTVDWIEPHGPWDDTLVFVFDGGTLSTATSTRSGSPTTSCRASASVHVMKPPSCCAPTSGNAPRTPSTHSRPAERATSIARPHPPRNPEAIARHSGHSVPSPGDLSRERRAVGAHT